MKAQTQRPVTRNPGGGAFLRVRTLSASPSTVTLVTRPTYDELMAAVDHLMLAHSEEVREGATIERKAATQHAYAVVGQLAYAATDRPERPAEPEDDPLLPKRRGKS